MSITTVEKEKFGTLKQTRLQFLTQASIERANSSPHAQWAHCLNFMNTIDHDSEAYKEAEYAASECSEFIRKAEAAVYTQASNPMAQYDAQEMGLPEVIQKGANRLLDGFWAIALKYRLIPTE